MSRQKHRPGASPARRSADGSKKIVRPNPSVQPMSVFERYLTLWVILCIMAGIALGQSFPAVFEALGRMEVAQVNLPVGLLIWIMIIPMLVKVD
ncbi:MAG: hypothetical protein RLZZ09_1302, partial [Pseudomonadota bacterium]